MMKKLLLLCFVVICTTIPTQAQILSLDSCRALAIANNKDLYKSSLQQNAAHWQRKAALTNYLPKISAIGTYQYTSQEISLLNDNQKQILGNLGTDLAGVMGQNFQQVGNSILNFPTSETFQAMMQNPQIVQIIANNPKLAETLMNPTIWQSTVGPMVQASQAAYSNMLNTMAAAVDGLGQKIIDAFRTDTRNIFGATVMLTQPIYMGGKIVAYDHITKYAEQIANEKHNMQLQDLVVSVDEAYWRIVALQAKKNLANSFVELIKKLDNDVTQLAAEGLATKADELSVKVKLNEAELAVIQVDNGLKLSRMALAQLCGMPLDAYFVLADETTPANGKIITKNEMQNDTSFVDMAMENRSELQALDLAAKIKREQVKVARSAYLPHIALTGGYLASSPSIYNGFENKFKGMWNVGVTMNIPILTWGERIYKVKQAKAEAEIAETEAINVREKITLQVNQNQQKLQEARERLNASIKSQERADENMRIATLGMQEGVIPVSNVLQAQTAWLMAHSTLVEAEVDLRLADTYLSRALGTIK